MCSYNRILQTKIDINKKKNGLLIYEITWINLTNIMLGKRIQTERVHTIKSYLYVVQEQANLKDGAGNQYSSFLFRACGSSHYWLRATQRNHLVGDENILISSAWLCIWVFTRNNLRSWTMCSIHYMHFIH